MNDEVRRLMLEGLRMDYESRDTTDIDEKVLHALAIEAIDARLAAITGTPAWLDKIVTVPSVPNIEDPIKVTGKLYRNVETGQKYTLGIGRPPKWVSEYRKAHPAK